MSNVNAKKILILFVFSITYNLTKAAEYNHPGQGDFVEVGTVNSKSPYGYEVNTFYAVPRFSGERLTLEGFKLDYDLIQTSFVIIGPVISYNFPPYAGTEVDHLEGMKRAGFVDYGVLVDFSIPFGQLFLQYTRADHKNPGSIFRSTFASAIPLLKLGQNHMWLNFYFEYSMYSSSTADHFFGVMDNEVNSDRAETSFESLESFTQIYGLWTPIYGQYWFNITYKLEKFANDVLKSSIVKRRTDQSVLIGLMYSFN